MTHLVESDRLRAALVTCEGRPWREVEHHATIPSTNARALQLARPGVVVVADHQSAGRGRLARSWESAPGSSLLLTATLPLPPPGSYDAGWLPLLTGLAVRRAVHDVTGLDAALKWPNDVLLPADGDRKVCGILCEVVSPGPDQRVVAVGVGLNVAQDRGGLPVPTATSLALALGAERPGAAPAPVDLTGLAATVLRHLATAHAALLDGGAAAAGERAAYRQACATLGREVRLSRPVGDDVVGLAVEVDDNGRLVIEVAGRRTAWAAGDVVHVRPAG